MPHRPPTFGALLLALALSTSSLAVAAPLVLTTQGRLLDNADQPVNGPATLVVSIYPVAENPQGGNDVPALWTGTYSVNVTNGLFTVDLGLQRSGSPAFPDDLFAGAGERWLGLKVNDGTELRPRLRFNAVPQAAVADFARNAEKLSNKSLAEIQSDFDTRYLRAGVGGQGNLSLGGDVQAGGKFIGDGSGLTNLDATKLTGEIDAARLPAGLARLDGAQTFTGANTFNTLTATGSLTLPVAEARTSCNLRGAAYFNSVDSALYLCDGSAWKRAGAAPGPRLSWNVARLEFGSAGIGTPGTEKSATLQNDGAAPASGLSVGATNGYSLKATTCTDTLGAGSSCTATFEMITAGTPGARSGHGIAFSSNGGTPGVQLAGTVLAPDGTLAARAARSCKSIKEFYPASQSSEYFLIKDGNTDPSQAYKVYCDMQTNGGGWTLAVTLNTTDGATRDYDDTVFWTSATTFGAPSNFNADHKSQAFLDLAINTEFMMVAHINGAPRGWAAYDLLPIAQGKSMQNWFTNFTNTTITGVRKGNSGSVGTNGPRTGGDAFIDNAHAVIVNSTYSPVDAQNVTRLGTNYASACASIDCNGHNFGGWGGRHLRSGWGAYYEGAQLNGYCATWGGYGSNGRAYSGNNAFLGTGFSGGCSAGGTMKNDLMVFVR